jgi:membrane protease YdiL (CAAX protease family)
VRTLDRGKLTAWTGLVGVLVLLGYASRAAGGKPPKDFVYHYSSAVAGLAQYAIVLAVVLAIARPRWALLALRRPAWSRSATSAVVLAVVAVYATSYVVDLFANPGKEQGLTSSHWDSHRAAPFAVNFVVLAIVAPAIEELTFRGLGYSLLEPLGRMTAIVVVGLAFGLAHGLLEGLPILVVFGAGLALIRSRTDSAYPGMVVHAAFNAIALIASVST